jgi:hypothetical protein
VIARCTLNNWKTASDVVAEFNSDSHQANHPGEYDHFNFKIKISDRANLESKVLLLAVKYNVNGQEYWDNNDSANFQIKFKKMPSMHEFKDEMQASPQSNSLSESHKELAASISSKPRSIPLAFKNFANATGAYESNQLSQLVNSRLSGSTPQRRLPGDEYIIGLECSTPVMLKRNAQPFRSRYDFDSSLSAAIQGTNTTPAGHHSLGSTTIAKIERRNARHLPQATTSTSPISTANFLNKNKAALVLITSDSDTPSTAAASSRLPRALPSGAEKSVLSTETYNKLIQTYYFVRTVNMSIHSYH